MADFTDVLFNPVGILLSFVLMIIPIVILWLGLLLLNYLKARPRFALLYGIYRRVFYGFLVFWGVYYLFQSLLNTIVGDPSLVSKPPEYYVTYDPSVGFIVDTVWHPSFTNLYRFEVQLFLNALASFAVYPIQILPFIFVVAPLGSFFILFRELRRRAKQQGKPLSEVLSEIEFLEVEHPIESIKRRLLRTEWKEELTFLKTIIAILPISLFLLMTILKILGERESTSLLAGTALGWFLEIFFAYLAVFVYSFFLLRAAKFNIRGEQLGLRQYESMVQSVSTVGLFMSAVSIVLFLIDYPAQLPVILFFAVYFIMVAMFFVVFLDIFEPFSIFMLTQMVEFAKWLSKMGIRTKIKRIQWKNAGKVLLLSLAIAFLFSILQFVTLIFADFIWANLTIGNFHYLNFMYVSLFLATIVLLASTVLVLRRFSWSAASTAIILVLGIYIQMILNHLWYTYISGFFFGNRSVPSFYPSDITIDRRLPLPTVFLPAAAPIFLLVDLVMFAFSNLFLELFANIAPTSIVDVFRRIHGTSSFLLEQTNSTNNYWVATMLRFGLFSDTPLIVPLTVFIPVIYRGNGRLFLEPIALPFQLFHPAAAVILYAYLFFYLRQRFLHQKVPDPNIEGIIHQNVYSERKVFPAFTELIFEQERFLLVLDLNSPRNQLLMNYMQQINMIFQMGATFGDDGATLAEYSSVSGIDKDQLTQILSYTYSDIPALRDLLHFYVDQRRLDLDPSRVTVEWLTNNFQKLRLVVKESPKIIQKEKKEWSKYQKRLEEMERLLQENPDYRFLILGESTIPESEQEETTVEESFSDLGDLMSEVMAEVPTKEPTTESGQALEAPESAPQTEPTESFDDLGDIMKDLGFDVPTSSAEQETPLPSSESETTTESEPSPMPTPSPVSSTQVTTTKAHKPLDIIITAEDFVEPPLYNRIRLMKIVSETILATSTEPQTFGALKRNLPYNLGEIYRALNFGYTSIPDFEDLLKLYQREFGYSHEEVVLDSLHVMKTDGRTIFTYEFRGTSQIDPSLVSGLFTAISSFAKEAVQSQERLTSIDHGDVFLTIEYSSPKVGLFAAVFSDKPSTEVRQKLKQFIKEFETKYEKYLIDYIGDMDVFKDAEELVKRIFLEEEKSEE